MIKLFFVLFFIYSALGVNSQPIFEIRNFYTNKPLSSQLVFVNGNRLFLDSVGRFTIKTLADSNYIVFPEFTIYHILLLKNNIKNNEVYLIYQFDKYYVIESDVWFTKRSWLGLVKKRYLMPGKPEEGNKSDVFMNRDSLMLYERRKRYCYSKIDKKEHFLLLQIDQ
jgi:hypothetical protein